MSGGRGGEGSVMCPAGRWWGGGRGRGPRCQPTLKSVSRGLTISPLSMRLSSGNSHCRKSTQAAWSRSVPMISPNDGSSCCVDSRPRIDHGSSHGPAAPAAQVEPVGGAQGSAATPVRCMNP